MSMQHEFNELMRHKYLLCPDYDYQTDTWPQERKKCSGWLLTDFDTWHECPKHYNGEQHPEWEDYNGQEEQKEEVQTTAQHDSCHDDVPF